MKRSFSWMILFLFFISGCVPSTQAASVSFIQNTAEPSSTNHSSSHRYHIALVMKTLTNPFFVDMEKGARQAERELGIELIVKTAAQETSIEQQIEIVDELIHNQVDAIVIAPGESTRLIPILKKAQDQGIQIINIDNRIDQATAAKQGLNPIPFIGPDNTTGAYQAVREMNRLIQSPTRVAVVEGIPGSLNSQERTRGALRAFAENPNAILTTTVSAHWKIDEAYQVAQQIFAKYPNTGAIYCDNDMMALGVIKYLRETGRTQVLVGGYDALDEAREALRNGQLVVTVNQQAARQGYLGVQYAARALKGEPLPGTTQVDTIILTQQDLEK